MKRILLPCCLLLLPSCHQEQTTAPGTAERAAAATERLAAAAERAEATAKTTAALTAAARRGELTAAKQEMIWKRQDAARAALHSRSTPAEHAAVAATLAALAREQAALDAEVRTAFTRP